jgi:serine/threonine-protein kinase
MGNILNNILKVGMVLNNKWVILEFMGKGAMGEVYRAHQLNLKRDVVIKVISAEWLESCRDDQEELEAGLKRFRTEVQVMAQIRHPNVVQIYDHGSISVKKADEDVPVEYIAMEYIPGSTLRSTMSEDGFYPDEDLTRQWLMYYFFPVLDGVQAMHELQIAHRDLKPENVLLDGNVPKIADFGLARSCWLRSATQSIDSKGTPPYMPPEQFLDMKRTDHRADIYALGKILFEAIAGKMGPKTLPFTRVKLASPETPFFRKLDRIIQEATTEDRKERLGSVAELRKALQEAIDTLERKKSMVPTPKRSFSPLAHPKWIWTGIAVAIISVGLMAIWHLLSEPGKSSLRPKGPQITSQELAQPKASTLSETVLQSPITPTPTLHGKDEVTLYFVPGGNITIPENFGLQAGKLLNVDSFYMDETKVTNHQYVLFLNQVVRRITVEQGVVKGDGDIWLLLGEVKEGYEPIIFRDGKFFISDSMHAACPVLRVTGYGASAYARFYGKRLQHQTEWLFALAGTPEPLKKAAGDGSESLAAPDMGEVQLGMQGRTPIPEPMSGNALPVPSPVMLFEPNRYGIRGLNMNASEWGLRILTAPSAETIRETEYVVLGGLGSDLEKEYGIPSPISRYPWEAFEEVGFRCVQSATTALPGTEARTSS